MAIVEGAFERGLTIYGATEALRESVGEMEDLVNRTENEHYIARARTQVGANRVAAAWADGRAFTQEAGVALAVTVSGDTRMPSA